MAQWLVKKLSKLMGVSVRTLHHYDDIGLLKPSIRLENGYRLYSEIDLQRLQQILALKFLGFDLAQIKEFLHKKSSAIHNLQLQAVLLRKKADAFVRASCVIEEAIASAQESNTVDWQTIVRITEEYSMMDVMRNTQLAQLVNEDQLTMIVSYFTKVAQDSELLAWHVLHAELMNNLAANVGKKPSGKEGELWVAQYRKYALTMRSFLVKHGAIFNEMSQIIKHIIGDIHTAPLAEKVRYNKLMQEAAYLVGKRYQIEIPVAVETTAEMEAWMKAAVAAFPN